MRRRLEGRPEHSPEHPSARRWAGAATAAPLRREDVLTAGAACLVGVLALSAGLAATFAESERAVFPNAGVFAPGPGGGPVVGPVAMIESGR